MFHVYAIHFTDVAKYLAVQNLSILSAQGQSTIPLVETDLYFLVTLASSPSF